MPVEDMADPGAPAYPSEDGPPPTEIEPSAHVRSIWPAIYPKLLELVQEHTSTIIFVNNRRAAERLAKRLNELANGEGEQRAAGDRARRARRGRRATRTPASRWSLGRDRPRPPRLALPRGAHHGRGDAQVRAAALPRRDLLAGAGDRHGRRRPRDPGRVAEVGDPRPAADRPRRPRLGETSKGRIFPKYRGDLLECAVVARRMREGEIEETTIPQNPLDVLAQHLVSMAALDEWEVDEVERARHRHRVLPRPLARTARERARHARRPLPVRPLRRAAAADRLGPHRGHDPRPQRRAPAGRHQRRHDPRPRPLRRPPARRPPGRRARRGDGLRGAPRPDLPARRHAPGGSRKSPATG